MAALTLLAAASPITAAQACGGTERWLVKVATDSNADDIDVSSIEQTTVVALNDPGLRPAGVDGAENRLKPETKVYRIEGFLRYARSEKDGDYHLVLTDERTARYANATGMAPTGKSMVVESPNPDCLAGASRQWAC